MGLSQYSCSVLQGGRSCAADWGSRSRIRQPAVRVTSRTNPSSLVTSLPGPRPPCTLATLARLARRWSSSRLSRAREISWSGRTTPPSTARRLPSSRGWRGFSALQTTAASTASPSAPSIVPFKKICVSPSCRNTSDGWQKESCRISLVTLSLLSFDTCVPLP